MNNHTITFDIILIFYGSYKQSSRVGIMKYNLNMSVQLFFISLKFM